MSAHAESHAHAAAHEHHEHPNYMAIFWALFILTAVELWIAYALINSVTLMRVVLMGLAVVKAALVALYYMHLKTEKLLLYVIATTPISLFLLFLVMVGWDIVAGAY